MSNNNRGEGGSNNTSGNNNNNGTSHGPTGVVTTGGRVQQPRPQIKGAGPRIGGQGSGSTILVNSCQRGNPLLTSIKNIGWEYGDIVPDYQVGVSACILYLSLRYHRLHPEYIHNRIEKLQNMYTLRVILVMCDVKDHQTSIKEITKTAVVNSLTVVVAWTNEEAARYIEAYKSFEHKPPDIIKERVNNDHMSLLNASLTSVRGVNKTDVITLATNFGSMKRISTSTAEELSLCPGFGDVKAKRLREAFNQPFRVGETRNIKERGILPSDLQKEDESNANAPSGEAEASGSGSGSGFGKNGSPSKTTEPASEGRRISSLPKGKFKTAEEREQELANYSSNLQKEKRQSSKQAELEFFDDDEMDDDLEILEELGRNPNATSSKGKEKEVENGKEQGREKEGEDEEEEMTEEEQLQMALALSMAEGDQ